LIYGTLNEREPTVTCNLLNRKKVNFIKSDNVNKIYKFKFKLTE